MANCARLKSLWRRRALAAANKLMSEVFVCNSAELAEASSRGFELSGHKFFILRKGGRCFAYSNACPHLGIPLEWVEHQFLDLSQSMIQCANHNALFVIETGKCVAGPCAGQKLRPLKLSERDQQIFIELP